MNVTKLKNGTEEATPLVALMVMELNRLFDEDPIGFYELATLARDRSHEPWGDYRERLTQRGFIQNGHIHDSIRNIVVSATKGEGTALAYVHPAEGM